MEDFFEKGIFIHTKDLQANMLECLNALHSACPDVNFTSATCDNAFCGFRVHFSHPDVKTMLRKEYKLAAGSPILVYPLTTHLMIHNFNPEDNNVFQHDFRNVIERNFGKILNQRKIENRQASLVDIEIPEVKDLDIFSSNGYPEMEIKLPNLSKAFKVAFWCRHCEKPGHTYQECFEKNKSQNSDTPKKSKNKSSERNDIEMQARAEKKGKPLNLSKSAITLSISDYLEPNETFASKIGREQIVKAGFIPEDQKTSDELNERDKLVSNLNDPSSSVQNDITVPIVQIKQEVGENNYDYNQSAVKEEPDSLGDNLNDQDTCHFSTDGEDDIQIISDNTSTSDLNPSFRKSFFNSGNNEPARREVSSLKKTTNFPVTPRKPFDFMKSSGPTDASSAGISPRQQPRPSTSRDISNSLSERLEVCFSKAYEQSSVLDRKTLDAFLIHVKKKSNPKRVASNYTTDVEGLKYQLQQILYFYYNTPQTGSKEDIQFIKWLNGLVERFEGTIPRKRKRSSKYDDEDTST